MTLVFMFPGQSSCDPGMLDRALGLDPTGMELVAEASELLGRDLLGQYRPENPSIFATNRDVQVGVFLTSHLYLRALERAGVEADLSLGLSLGEYNHLVHIGALELPAALRLVDARGAAYDAGPDGVMVAVFPIDLETLEDVVAHAARQGCVEVVNLNSPTQHVIAGERLAVEAAVVLLEEADPLVQAVTIESAVPMHSSRFAPVADAFRPALAAAPWRRPRRPYLPNVLAEPLDAPAPVEIVDLLARHVHRPVHWRASIDVIVERYPGAVFCEVGPGAVLSNMLRRSWHDVRRLRTDRLGDDPTTAFRALVGELAPALR